ncbi:MAG: FHA domain-containing protein [Pseudomonadota bacterium]
MQCPHCGRESDPLFKFCLHCGRELTAKTVAPIRSPEPEPEPEALDRITGAAKVLEPEESGAEVSSTGEFGADAPPAGEEEFKADAGSAPPAPSETEPAEVSETVVPLVEATDGDGDRCLRCKARLQDGARACHLCGHVVGEAVVDQEASPQPEVTSATSDLATLGHLVTIDTATGKEAARINLHEGANSLGRRGCDIVFEADDLLSPHHVDIVVDSGGVDLVCPISLNGTFVRIDGQVKLEHGDMFRIGQQLLRFEEMRFVEPLIPEPDEGTRVMGSPTPSVVWGRLNQVVSTRLTASTFLLTGEQVRIGREKGDITFPGDRYMSGAHAVVVRRSDGYYLKDQTSSNGTFVRIKGRHALQQGRYFLAGRQLFRFERVA